MEHEEKVWKGSLESEPKWSKFQSTGYVRKYPGSSGKCLGRTNPFKIEYSVRQLKPWDVKGLLQVCCWRSTVSMTFDLSRQMKHLGALSKHPFHREAGILAWRGTVTEGFDSERVGLCTICGTLSSFVILTGRSRWDVCLPLSIWNMLGLLFCDGCLLLIYYPDDGPACNFQTYRKKADRDGKWSYQHV